jgi:hypothetical protein
MGEKRNVHKDLVGNTERKTSLDDQSLNGKIIMDLKTHVERAWSGFIWLRIGTSDGLL